MDQMPPRLSLILCACFLSLTAYCIQDDDAYFNELINRSTRDIFVDPENTIEQYEEGIARFMEVGDTLKVIRIMVNLADLHAQIADYSASYDQYWDALIIAEKYGNEEAKAAVYSGLGWLYSFYQRKEISVRYFNQSLNIKRKNQNNSPTINQQILSDYYALATLYRKYGDLKLANQYLDSCARMLKGSLDSETNRAFLKAERGYVLYKANKIDQSLQELNESRQYFESYDSSYLIIMYPFLGDIYKSKKMTSVSEDFYTKTIAISEIYKSHLDLIPDVYRKLSELYYEQGNYKLAHEYMLEFNKLNEIQFGSRSVSNQGLLEIKDDFRLEMERQNELIQQQELANLEQITKNKNLQLWILLLSMASIIFIGLLIYRNLRNRHKAEKILLEQQKEMEAQKNLEVIEAKNKELTASAIHVIEKEELLAETKNELLKQKDNPDPNQIHRVIKRINLSTNQSWKEFELRFLQVNKEFYRKLREVHANLSQNDHKICALIKLNFSSKDMSTLLGISIESVHTTRYRLRKKMGLDRNVNLEDYIANL